VIEIGSPHPQCAQEWHARVVDGDLPDTIQLGQGAPVGIVGQDTFLQRIGTRRDAVAELGRMP
jgi:hypothetical protein